MVIDGPMNGDILLAYVEQCLAPTLKPHDIVVLDNLPAHKVPGIEEAIKAAGATVCYYRSIRPISIRSRCPSANSRPTCESSHSGPCQVSTALSAPSCCPSIVKNAPTISGMQAKLLYDRILL